ncbi:MAG: hypothetical protein AAGD28_23970 [Bacteroidota bacterium]
MLRNIIRFFTLLLSCFLLSTQVLGQDNDPLADNAPKYSNEFLRIGIGARAFGMGNAQIAGANDVTAGYWNPAGLASEGALEYPEVALMHASYFANIANYNYLGFSIPVDTASRRRFAVTLIRMGIDDIPNTLQLVQPDGTIDYSKVESFSVTNLAGIFSYAWSPRSIPQLSFGANVKLIYRGVGRFGNAWGFGLDLAAKYKVGGLDLGLVVTDATQTYNAWTYNTETFEQDFINTGNTVYQNSIEITKPAVRFGLAYTLKLSRRINLLAAMDNDLYFDGQRVGSLASSSTVSWEPRAGLEIAYLNDQYRKVAFLRAGAYNVQRIQDIDGQENTQVFPTAGVGIVVKNFTIDYALANIGNLSENLHSHIVSLKFHVQ